MKMNKKYMDAQLRELQDCIRIYAIDLLWEPKANKADMVKAVIEGINIWERGIENKFKDDLSEQSSEILDCIDHYTYDEFHDPNVTKLMLLGAIDVGLFMWKEGMQIAIREKGKLI